MRSVVIACALFAAAPVAAQEAQTAGAPQPAPAQAAPAAPAQAPTQAPAAAPVRNYSGVEIEGPRQLFVSPFGHPYRVRMEEPYPAVFWFERADANGDGAITLEELREDASKIFNALDVNDDGYVDTSENARYEQRIAPEITGVLRPVDVIVAPTPVRSSSERGMRAQQVRLRTGAALYGLLNEPQPVRGADLDLDFRVSAEEQQKAADRRFRLLDVNADRKIEASELPRTPAQDVYDEWKRKNLRR